MADRNKNYAVGPGETRTSFAPAHEKRFYSAVGPRESKSVFAPAHIAAQGMDLPSLAMVGPEAAHGNRPSFSSMASTIPDRRRQEFPQQQVAQREGQGEAMDEIADKASDQTVKKIANLFGAEPEELTPENIQRFFQDIASQGELPSEAPSRESQEQAYMRSAMDQSAPGGPPPVPGFNQWAQAQQQQPAQPQAPQGAAPSRVQAEVSPHWQSNVDQSWDVLRNMKDIPTKEQFKSERGIKDPSWWQQMALGAAYGGPAEAQQAYDKRLESAYQDYISPQMQQREREKLELGLLSETRPEFSERSWIRIGDQEYLVNQDALSYVLPALGRQQEYELQRLDRVSFKDTFREFRGLEDVLQGMPDFDISPSEIPAFSQALLAMTQENLPNFEEWSIKVLQDVEAGKTRPAQHVELAKNHLKALSRNKLGKLSDIEMAQQFPALWEQVKREERQKKLQEDELRTATKTTEWGKMEEDVVLSLYESDQDDTTPGASKAREYIESTGVTSGELSDRDKRRYAQSTVLMDHLRSTNSVDRKNARERLRTQGIWFQGNQVRVDSSGAWGRAIPDDNMATFMGMLEAFGKLDDIDPEYKSNFLHHYFPVEIATYEQRAKEPLPGILTEDLEEPVEPGDEVDTGEKEEPEAPSVWDWLAGGVLSASQWREVYGNVFSGTGSFEMGGREIPKSESRKKGPSIWTPQPGAWDPNLKKTKTSSVTPTPVVPQKTDVSKAPQTTQPAVTPTPVVTQKEEVPSRKTRKNNVLDEIRRR